MCLCFAVHYDSSGPGRAYLWGRVAKASGTLFLHIPEAASLSSFPSYSAAF